MKTPTFGYPNTGNNPLPILEVLGEKSQDPPKPKTPAGNATADPKGKTEEITTDVADGPKIASVEAQEYRKKLQDARDTIKRNVESSKTQLHNKCAQLDELFCKQLSSDNDRREYERRFEKYDSVIEVLEKTGFEAIAAAAAALKERKTNNGKSTDTSDVEDQDAEKPDLSTSSGRLAAAESLYLDAMITAAITNAPKTVDKLFESIKNDSLRQDDKQKKFDPKFDPKFAKERIEDWKLLEDYATGGFEETYHNNKIYEEYREKYNIYWLGYPASRISNMIKRHDTWEEQREWLRELSVIGSVDDLEQMYQDTYKALDAFRTKPVPKRSPEIVSDRSLKTAFSFWKGSGSSKPIEMRLALLNMLPVDWVDECCPIRNSERALLVGLYLSELAEQTIQVLAVDVEKTRNQGIKNVTNLAKKFPFSRKSLKDITDDEISDMQADLKTIPSGGDWKEGSIGYGKDIPVSPPRQSQSDFAGQLLKDIEIRQRDINTAFNKLRAALQMTPDSDEGKRIKKIETLLACLNKVDTCIVRVADSKGSHGMFTDFRIRYKGRIGKEEWKRTSNYGESFPAERLPPSWDEFWVEVFPTVDARPGPEDISKYENDEIPNRPRFGPYAGKWAFLRMIFSKDRGVIQSDDKSKWVVEFPLEHKGNSGITKEELCLQLEFTKDGKPVEWPSLSEWPN